MNSAPEGFNKIIFGMMNHPALPLQDEIKFAKKLGFDFLDLTLEPPEAGPEKFDIQKAQRWIEKAGLQVTGHTGWYLPGNAAYPEVRQGVVDSLVWAGKHFSTLGAKTMTYHIQGRRAKYIGLKAAIRSQVEILRKASKICDDMGVTIVLEHISAAPGQFEILDALFDKVPSLGFHIDVGHANLECGGVNQTTQFLKRYGKRLRHVHISDNRSYRDDHMPLGVGSIDWPTIAKQIKKIYRGPVTLEVFTEDPEYLKLSLAKARKWFR